MVNNLLIIPEQQGGFTIPKVDTKQNIPQEQTTESYDIDLETPLIHYQVLQDKKKVRA